MDYQDYIETGYEDVKYQHEAAADKNKDILEQIDQEGVNDLMVNKIEDENPTHTIKWSQTRLLGRRKQGRRYIHHIQIRQRRVYKRIDSRNQTN